MENQLRKEDFENTAFEAVNKGDGKRIIAFYEALGVKNEYGYTGNNNITKGIRFYYGYSDELLSAFCYKSDFVINFLEIKPFSIIEQWEQAKKEPEKVNEATKQTIFADSVLEAIRTFEDDYDDILDYSDKSVTVSIKMHGVRNSVTIQDDDLTIQKAAGLFNRVLLGASFSQEVIDQVLNVEK